MNSKNNLVLLTLFFACIVSHTNPILLADVISADAGKQLNIINTLELRGYIQIGGHWNFSLHDPETGRAFWLGTHDEKYGVKVIKVNPEAKTVTVQSGRHIRELIISGALLVFPNKVPTHTNQVVTNEKNTLSPYNTKLLEKHSLLIKETFSPKTGRKLRNHVAQRQLADYIKTNPSVEEFYRYAEQNESQIDWDELLSIQFEGLHGRNASNTAAWDVDKSVTYDDINLAIQNNASVEEINQLLKGELNH